MSLWESEKSFYLTQKICDIDDEIEFDSINFGNGDDDEYSVNTDDNDDNHYATDTFHKDNPTFSFIVTPAIAQIWTAVNAILSPPI